jgi:hypothetical protein
MLAIVCSSGRSLPSMNVLASPAGALISSAWASSARFSTGSITKSGPTWIAFFTVQRSMDRRMPSRSLSERSSGSSIWILKTCL